MGIMVLIPSYNVAPTIAYVVSTAAKGLKEYFPDQDNLILVSDGGSTNGTVEVVKSLKIKDVEVRVERYKGIPGKGSAILYGLEMAVNGGYDAVIMLDSDLRSVEPWWIRLLGEAAGSYGLVTPLYVRDKHDGTITKTLAYPTIKSVFGADVRQPIGGDFGISSTLAKVLLERKEEFAPDVYRFGIDFFITSTAVAEDMRIARADLGSKIHSPKDPGKHLKGMFFDVSRTVIRAILKYWRKAKSRRGVSTDLLKWRYSWRCPQHVEVDIKANINRFITEYREKRRLLRELLGGYTDEIDMVVDRLKRGLPEAFPDDLWAKLFFKLAVEFRREMEKSTEALYILWLGKVASYLQDSADLDIEGAEKRVEGIVRAFKENLRLLTALD